jgi:hypothetical protein
MPFSLLKVNWRFRGRNRLHLQGEKQLASWLCLRNIGRFFNGLCGVIVQKLVLFTSECIFDWFVFQ